MFNAIHFKQSMRVYVLSFAFGMVIFYSVVW